MPTETDLVNVALTMIAHEKIQSIATTNDNVAEKARLLYPVARDASLRAADWNCATWRRELAEVPEAELVGKGFNTDEWAHVYTLPGDPKCLRARRLESSCSWTGAIRRFHPGPVAFRVEGERFLLTNVGSPTLVYTRLLTDVEIFDSMLFLSTATLLAHLFALSIRQDYKRADALMKSWIDINDQASGCNQAEGTQDTYISTDLLHDR